MLEVLEDALSELPEAQRSVFIAQEMNGSSFPELSVQTGESVNVESVPLTYLARSMGRMHKSAGNALRSFTRGITSRTRQVQKANHWATRCSVSTLAGGLFYLIVGGHNVSKPLINRML